MMFFLPWVWLFYICRFIIRAWWKEWECDWGFRVYTTCLWSLIWERSISILYTTLCALPSCGCEYVTTLFQILHKRSLDFSVQFCIQLFSKDSSYLDRFLKPTPDCIKTRVHGSFIVLNHCRFLNETLKIFFSSNIANVEFPTCTRLRFWKCLFNRKQKSEKPMSYTYSSDWNCVKPNWNTHNFQVQILPTLFKVGLFDPRGLHAIHIKLLTDDWSLLRF